MVDAFDATARHHTPIAGQQDRFGGPLADGAPQPISVDLHDLGAEDLQRPTIAVLRDEYRHLPPCQGMVADPAAGTANRFTDRGSDEVESIAPG